MWSPDANKRAADAIWEWFRDNLATGHFSFRDEYDKEVSATEPIACKPGDTLEALVPLRKPGTDNIDSVWVVYSKADGEWMLSLCLGNGNMNGKRAIAYVLKRENITIFGH